MRIIGVGIDVADLSRFRRLLVRGRGAANFWSHWYTRDEAAQCARHREPALAATMRFAVKEAVLKSLRYSFVGPPRWRDIEILGEGSTLGVQLYGELDGLAHDLQLASFHVAVSQQQSDRVMALVVAEGLHGDDFRQEVD